VQFLHNVGSALTHARPGLLLVAIALHLAGLAVTGERWRGIIVSLGGRVTLARSTIINLAGIFVRNATPTTGLGGDASRIALLRAEGVTLPQAAASFVYVRAAELPSIAAVVLIALPVLGGAIARSSRQIAWALAAAAAVAGAIWIARRRVRAGLQTFRERMAHLRIPRGAFAVAVAYAAVAQIETLVRQMAVAAALGFPISLQQSATITALSIAGGLVPTVGSIGAIDGSIVAGLMICGAPADTAVAITLVERAISYGLSTALGAAALAGLGGRAILRFKTDRSTDAVTAS
jgi:uncharacterized membrane protein YbhN (UPF0104 family)